MSERQLSSSLILSLPEPLKKSQRSMCLGSQQITVNKSYFENILYLLVAFKNRYIKKAGTMTIFFLSRSGHLLFFWMIQMNIKVKESRVLVSYHGFFFLLHYKTKSVPYDSDVLHQILHCSSLYARTRFHRVEIGHISSPFLNSK